MSGYLFLMWLCLRLLKGHSNGGVVYTLNQIPFALSLAIEEQ